MKTIKDLEIKYNHLVTNIFLGNYKTAFRGNGMEFSNFKNYEYGEDSKNIDWLISAREGKVITREFQENRELEVLFLFDITKSMNFGFNKKKIDTLIDIFYLLGLSTLNSGGSIGGIFLGKDKVITLFSKGKEALIKILKNIKLFSNKNYMNGKILDFKNIINYKNKLIFILTDKLEIDEKNFHISSLKNDIIYINIFDTFENTLSGIEGNIGIGGISINLDDNFKKAKYIKLREDKRDKLKLQINKLGGDYLFLDNKSNLYKKILKLMRERQK